MAGISRKRTGRADADSGKDGNRFAFFPRFRAADCRTEKTAKEV